MYLVVGRCCSLLIGMRSASISIMSVGVLLHRPVMRRAACSWMRASCLGGSLQRDGILAQHSLALA